MCAVVDAQDLLCIGGEPEGNMLPIPIMGAHFANVYPVKQLQAKLSLKYSTTSMGGKQDVCWCQQANSGSHDVEPSQWSIYASDHWR